MDTPLAKWLPMLELSRSPQPSQTEIGNNSAFISLHPTGFQRVCKKYETWRSEYREKYSFSGENLFSRHWRRVSANPTRHLLQGLKLLLVYQVELSDEVIKVFVTGVHMRFLRTKFVLLYLVQQKL